MTTSPISARRSGNEIAQIFRAGTGLRPTSPLCARPISVSALRPTGGRLSEQPEGVRVVVQMHDHAGQQRTTLVVLTEVEIADLEGELRGDVLEEPVLRCF